MKEHIDEIEREKVPNPRDVFGPRVTVIYDSYMFRLPRLAIGQQGGFAGWLLAEHPDGQWVSLADLKPHFVQPVTDEAKASAQHASRVAELERAHASLVEQRDRMREAAEGALKYLTCDSTPLSAVDIIEPLRAALAEKVSP